MSHTHFPHHDRQYPDDHDIALLIARVLLIAIFPISGYFKIVQWPAIVTTLTQQGAPLPMLGGYLAIAVELLCPLLILIGLWARGAAVVLILYIAGTMVIAHRFWEFSGGAQVGQLFSFMKNLAMIGGLGLIAVIGAGRYAVRPGS